MSKKYCRNPIVLGKLNSTAKAVLFHLAGQGIDVALTFKDFAFCNSNLIVDILLCCQGVGILVQERSNIFRRDTRIGKS